MTTFRSFLEKIGLVASKESQPIADSAQTEASPKDEAPIAESCSCDSENCACGTEQETCGDHCSCTGESCGDESETK